MNDLLEFIYVLKIEDKYLNKKNWTDKEDIIINEHFDKLLELKEEGKLILAGRTQTWDKNSFGIVILNVSSEAEAMQIMENDPAVIAKVLKAELYPYKVAIMMDTIT